MRSNRLPARCHPFAVVALTAIVLSPSSVPAADAPATAPATATATATAPPAGPPRNPLYVHWAAFKPGSFVRLVSTTVLPGSGDKVKVEYVVSLVEVKPDDVTLEVVTTTFEGGVGGKPVITRQRVPAVDPAAGRTAPAEESVTAAGRDIPCSVFSVRYRTPPADGLPPVPTTVRMWLSDTVPGGLVKLTSSGPAGETTVVLDESRPK